MLQKLKESRIISLLLIVSAGLIINSCGTSKTFQGGAAGAGAGGVIGGVIGSESGNTAKGAIIGAAIGGTAGALIGNYMDKQAEELREDLEGAEVERVGEGIKITFDSGILFGFDSYALTEQSRENIRQLGEVLKKYDDTEVLIEGHTDSKGSKSYNLELSQERAESVGDYLVSRGVDDGRISEVGYGERQPIADNDTEQGRMQNRRVEVAIFANDRLKRAAKNGEIGQE